MQEIITFKTASCEEMVDITDQIRSIVSRHPEHSLCAIFARGATAAIMVQENWDPNISADILSCLRSLIPAGKWLHDRIDGNGDAHLKAGIIGPSETIHIIRGELMLGRWQNIFFCEFDGPRQRREAIVTLL